MKVTYDGLNGKIELSAFLNDDGEPSYILAINSNKTILEYPVIDILKKHFPEDFENIDIAFWCTNKSPKAKKKDLTVILKDDKTKTPKKDNKKGVPYIKSLIDFVMELYNTLDDEQKNLSDTKKLYSLLNEIIF